MTRFIWKIIRYCVNKYETSIHWNNIRMQKLNLRNKIKHRCWVSNSYIKGKVYIFRCFYSTWNHTIWYRVYSRKFHLEAVYWKHCSNYIRLVDNTNSRHNLELSSQHLWRIWSLRTLHRYSFELRWSILLGGFFVCLLLTSHSICIVALNKKNYL